MKALLLKDEKHYYGSWIVQVNYYDDDNIKVELADEVQGVLDWIASYDDNTEWWDNVINLN